jgi:pilus assembly protein Flp/PilA
MFYLYDQLVARLSREDEGQTLVEYALILALVSIVAIGTLAALGVKINGVLTTVTNQL